MKTSNKEIRSLNNKYSEDVGYFFLSLINKNTAYSIKN
jgi:hypothetical protein